MTAATSTPVRIVLGSYDPESGVRLGAAVAALADRLGVELADPVTETRVLALLAEAALAALERG